MTTVKAKTKSGHIESFQFEEIIEIDGKRYASDGDVQGLRDLLLHFEGRLVAIEGFLSTLLRPVTDEKES